MFTALLGSHLWVVSEWFLTFPGFFSVSGFEIQRKSASLTRARARQNHSTSVFSDSHRGFLSLSSSNDNIHNNLHNNLKMFIRYTWMPFLHGIDWSDENMVSILLFLRLTIF